jgi:hypothetical protein
VSRRSGGLACIAAAVVLATSCGGGDEAATADSGIEGVAWTGPTCAVERAPPDAKCADRLLARATVRAQHGNRVLAETETDARGRFRLRLPPGEYQLYASGGMTPFAAPVASARVVESRFTRVELHVDTGIR